MTPSEFCSGPFFDDGDSVHIRADNDAFLEIVRVDENGEERQSFLVEFDNVYALMMALMKAMNWRLMWRIRRGPK